MAQYDLQWDDSRIEDAFLLSSMFGATNKQMAIFMKVSMDTIEYWIQHKKEFREAVERGKMIADLEVAKAWYRCAIGYEYDEEIEHMYRGMIVKGKIKRVVRPDPWSCAKWLGIRQRENFADVQRMEVTNTTVNINKLDFSGITKEELELLEKIGLRQLTAHVPDN